MVRQGLNNQWWILSQLWKPLIIQPHLARLRTSRTSYAVSMTVYPMIQALIKSVQRIGWLRVSTLVWQTRCTTIHFTKLKVSKSQSKVVRRSPQSWAFCRNNRQTNKQGPAVWTYNSFLRCPIISSQALSQERRPPSISWERPWTFQKHSIRLSSMRAKRRKGLMALRIKWEAWRWFRINSISIRRSSKIRGRSSISKGKWTRS